MHREELILLWVMDPRRKLSEVHLRSHYFRPFRLERVHKASLIFHFINIYFHECKLWLLSRKLPRYLNGLIFDSLRAENLGLEYLLVHNHSDFCLTYI